MKRTIWIVRNDLALLEFTEKTGEVKFDFVRSVFPEYATNFENRERAEEVLKMVKYHYPSSDFCIVELNR